MLCKSYLHNEYTKICCRSLIHTDEERERGREGRGREGMGRKGREGRGGKEGEGRKVKGKLGGE